jgi:hypothetical protein
MTCAMKFQDDRKVQFTVSRDTYDKLRRMQDLLRHQVPDGDPAAIRREVVTKQRRALVVYGDGHLFRAGQSLVGQLERDAGIKVFTIATAMSTMFEDLSALQPDLSSWPIPSLAVVRGTALDAKQLVYRDAVLYLGPPSAITFSRLPARLCSDPRYIEMRVQRAPLGAQPQIRQQLMHECASGAVK